MRIPEIVSLDMSDSSLATRFIRLDAMIVEVEGFEDRKEWTVH